MLLISEHPDGVTVLYSVDKYVSREWRLASPSYDQRRETTRLVRVNRDGTVVDSKVVMPPGMHFYPNFCAVIPQSDGIYTYDRYTRSRAPDIYRIPYVASEGGDVIVEKLANSSDRFSQLNELVNAKGETTNQELGHKMLFFDNYGFDGLIANSVSNAIQIEGRFDEGVGTLYAVFPDTKDRREAIIGEIDMSRHPVE